MVPMMPTSGANTPTVAQWKLLPRPSFLGTHRHSRARRHRAWVVHTQLAVQPDGRTRHQWFAQRKAGPVDGVAGGEVVGAVQHHIGLGHQCASSAASARCVTGTTFTSGLMAAMAVQKTVRFGLADALQGVGHLALEVAASTTS